MADIANEREDVHLGDVQQVSPTVTRQPTSPHTQEASAAPAPTKISKDELTLALIEHTGWG
jgi:hypothetical protein